MREVSQRFGGKNDFVSNVAGSLPKDNCPYGSILPKTSIFEAHWCDLWIFYAVSNVQNVKIPLLLGGL